MFFKAKIVKYLTFTLVTNIHSPIDSYINMPIMPIQGSSFFENCLNDRNKFANLKTYLMNNSSILYGFKIE